MCLGSSVGKSVTLVSRTPDAKSRNDLLGFGSAPPLMEPKMLRS